MRLLMKLLLTVVLTIVAGANAEDPRTQVPGQAIAQPTGVRRVNLDRRSMVVEPSWWRAADYRYQVGYDSAAGGTGILGENVITGGFWFDESLGLDIYLGYTKAGNANNESISDVTNTVAVPNTKTTTTLHTGTNTARTLAIAAGLKYRMYQSDWFQLNLGFVAAFFPGGSADFNTGRKVETFTDASNLNNRTVTETDLGTITSETSTQLSFGPRLGTEFYIKWFPHLAVGFATGILTSVSGNTTTTTDTKTRTYTVVNGTESAPTASSSTHTVSTTTPGFRGTTFGIGGTTFAFTGTFSIRYVW